MNQFYTPTRLKKRFSADQTSYTIPTFEIFIYAINKNKVFLQFNDTPYLHKRPDEMLVALSDMNIIDVKQF